MNAFDQQKYKCGKTCCVRPRSVMWSWQKLALLMIPPTSPQVRWSVIVTLRTCYATVRTLGLPILHTWKWIRKIPEALRPQAAAPPIPRHPGCYDNQGDMQIEPPCVVTMGICSTEKTADARLHHQRFTCSQIVHSDRRMNRQGLMVGVDHSGSASWKKNIQYLLK